MRVVGTALLVGVGALFCARPIFAQVGREAPAESQPGVIILPARPLPTAPVPLPASPLPPPTLAPTLAPPLSGAASPPEAPTAQELPPADERRTARRLHVWYGYQTLIADVVLFSSGAVGIALKEPTLTTVGVIGYFAGAPVIHFAHGHVGRGFGDFGLRCAFPVGGLLVGTLVGAFAASAQSSSASTDTVVTGLAIGAVAGVAGAIAFDAAFLADETVEHTDGEARARPPLPSFVARPTIGVVKGGVAVGLAGSF